MANPLQTIDAPQRPHLEQPLPQHGLLYFDHLNAELQSKLSQSIDQELKVVIDNLLKKR